MLESNNNKKRKRVWVYRRNEVATNNEPVVRTYVILYIGA